MANMTVVRNAAYTMGSVGIRERHNERKNECYSNADIQLERSPMNVHFKQCVGTYTQEFDRLLADGAISTRGLKPGAKVIDEMIFDVNTLYFENNGGYEFAKRFYEEAYRLAVKEAGDERYILSAVMHADEVNVGASAALGKDVYHYHLHVVYIPVVEKEIKWSKRCKDTALAGTTKEIINQVSHSKKWPRNTLFDENGEIIRNSDGKAILVNSYSLLQDRFYEHMKDVGFKDFERGQRGSTAEHRSDMEFKIHKDMERLERLGQAIEKKETKATELDEKIEAKRAILQTVHKRITVAKDIAAHYRDIDGMAKPTLLGKKVEVSKQNWESVSNLAKEGYLSRGKIEDLSDKLRQANNRAASYKWQFEELYKKTKWFLQALERFPEKVTEFLKELLKPKEKEKEAAPQLTQNRKRSREHGR